MSASHEWKIVGYENHDINNGHPLKNNFDPQKHHQVRVICRKCGTDFMWSKNKSFQEEMKSTFDMLNMMESFFTSIEAGYTPQYIEFEDYIDCDYMIIQSVTKA